MNNPFSDYYQVDKLITLKQFELAEALNKMSHEGGGDQEHAVST